MILSNESLQEIIQTKHFTLTPDRVINMIDDMTSAAGELLILRRLAFAVTDIVAKSAEEQERMRPLMKIITELTDFMESEQNKVKIENTEMEMMQ